MAPITNTRVVVAKHVETGESFALDNVRTETVELNTSLDEGDILIRNIYLGLDPYTRFSFQSPAPTLGKTVAGFGIGEVIESKNTAYPVSSVVTGYNIGWEQFTRFSNPQLFIIPDAHHSMIPLTEYLNALGPNGLTAYAAVETLIKFKKDQKVFISSAAGSVGSLIAILAKRAGAFVIGSAGSDDKVQYIINYLGIDAGINYKTQDTRAQLDTIAPGGIDLYIDLVGGETLDIALEKLKTNGQVVVIGNISVVNAKTPYLTKNLHLIVFKALTITGFTVLPHRHRFPELWKKFGPLIANGEIKTQKVNPIKGVEHAGQAFADYLSGEYHGKVVVEVASL
ncbi:hypothetical protein BGX28_001530, partial [Mortierella sp. GBA30]